ncbi:LysR substrate-binding domain-containing protein [Bradyrhizobium sp. USDA 4473]
MNIELRDLRWAIVVAQHRSLRQAAEALHVRQSTVSRRVRDLEYQLGSALFERTNGGTRPTKEGQDFLERARRIVEETEAISERFKIRSRGESGSLSIGVHAALSAGNLRASLIEHRRRYPDVEIHLVDGSSDHLISDLESSALDIAFVVEGNHRWTGKSLSVWSERFVVALPGDHALAQQDNVQWADLRGQRLLLPQRGPGPEFLQLLLRKLGDQNPCPVLRQDVSADRLLTLVGAGWGIALALEGATGATYPGVTFRGVHDNDKPTRLGFRAYWRLSNQNPSLRPFLDMLRERYPELPGLPVAD